MWEEEPRYLEALFCQLENTRENGTLEAISCEHPWIHHLICIFSVVQNIMEDPGFPRVRQPQRWLCKPIILDMFSQKLYEIDNKTDRKGGPRP